MDDEDPTPAELSARERWERRVLPALAADQVAAITDALRRASAPDGEGETAPRARPRPPGQRVLRLRIELVDVEPTVWRQILVPGSIRLAKFHGVIQAAMGWENYHLHAFEVAGTRYGMQFDDYPEGELDEKSITLLAAAHAAPTIGYEYDFGDGWEHLITVEEERSYPLGLKHAVCVAGAGRCPPEDCGGPGGYADLLEVLADPTHDEHDHLRSWAGGLIDPNEFDLASINIALQRVR